MGRRMTAVKREAALVLRASRSFGASVCASL